MDNIDIKDLDCSRMCIHPNSPKLVPFLEQNIPQLKSFKEYKGKVFNKSQIYRYILFVYDPNSPILKMTSLDYWAMKWQACAYAGFPQKKSKHDGQMRFDEQVLNMVLGKNTDILDMIFLFVKWTNVKDWDYVVFLNEAMAQHTLSAMKNRQSSKDIKEIKELRKEKVEIERQMSRDGEETEEFISRFYYNIEQSRLAIRPEDYSRKLESGDDLRGDNPYSVSYTVEQLKFVGDKLPDE